MKRRRFISFVFVLILCFGMSGCGKEKKTTAPNKFQSDYMEVWGGTTVEEGDFRVINGLLYYIDFETMEEYRFVISRIVVIYHGKKIVIQNVMRQI